MSPTAQRPMQAWHTRDKDARGTAAFPTWCSPGLLPQWRYARLPAGDPQAVRSAWKEEAQVTLHLKSPWGERQPQKFVQEIQPETTNLSLAHIPEVGLGREGHGAQH